MKQLAIFTAIQFSLFLAACGGETETKKGENEQKTPPSIVTNSTMANQSNSTMANQSNSTVVNRARVDEDDNDADDVRPSNSANANNSVKRDSDDLKGKDADDVRKSNSNVRGKDKDDLNKKGDSDDKGKRDNDGDDN